MAYFRCVGGVGGGAVLTLTYSSEFYGETITATDGTKTVTKVAPSTGTMDITLPESGTWVVSSTISGQTYSTTVTVDLEYTATLEAIPDGSTVTPTDDIQTWLKCAGIRDKTTYTTLADVLADTDTFIALCADSNACDYMARSTNWASGVAADSTAMLIVGKYNYCGNKLISNATWCEALAGSSYWEYIFNGCVPKMTSNTAPSGEVTGTTPRDTTTYALWKAFDRDTSTIYSGNVNTAANSTGGGFIQYHHTEPVCIKGIKLQSHTSNVYPYKSVKVEVSNDGSTYDTIFDDSVDFVTGYVDTSDNIKTGTYTKVTVTQLNDTGSSTYFPRIIDCQFYGRTDNANYIPLVPTMTSNTTPSGEASASTVLPDGQHDFNAYKAFDNSLADYSIWQASANTNQWIDYEFPTAVQCDRATFRAPYYDNQASRIKQYKIQGSNDGSNYTDLTEVLTCPNTRDGSHIYTPLQTVDFTKNKGTYTHYRLFVIDIWNTQSGWYTACYELQFYAKQRHTLIHSAVEDNIFYMDDGSPVALCGIPIGDTIDVDLEAYKGQTLTLVSTVAKDPTNLSNDFSMNVRITPNITEIYLMPLRELYWWGHKGATLDIASTASGWTYSGTFLSPSYQKNYADCDSYNAWNIICFTTKNAVHSASKVCAIGQGIRKYPSDHYLDLQGRTSKTFNDGASGLVNGTTTLDVTTMAKIENDVSGGSDFYPVANTAGNQCYVYAVWYEV